MLEGHGVGVVHAADDGDGGVLLVEFVGGVAEDGDEWGRRRGGWVPRASSCSGRRWRGAGRGARAGAEEVDGAGLAVVVGEDADVGLVFGGEGLEGAVDEVDLLLPAEAVRVELREGAGAGGFGGGVVEVEGGGVANQVCGVRMGRAMGRMSRPVRVRTAS